MNIQKEYITKTRDYLKDLDYKINSIDTIKKEIEMLKVSGSTYREINFDILGIKSQGPTKGIDDMVISREQMIYIKECEIDFIKKKDEIIKDILSNMGEVEKQIIELRYFKKGENNSRLEISEIAKEIKYSKATVKRKELKAIKQIAYWKYGDECIEKVEPLLSRARAV